jgi:hypothetical protein
MSNAAEEATPSIICPCCKQSYIARVKVIPLHEQNAWICDECDAWWTIDPAIDIGSYSRFGEFMAVHGLPEDRNLLIYID